jgi:hypothetical protein
MTGLTDFELRPIEEQDINYDDAVSMFSSARSMLSKQQATYLGAVNNIKPGSGSVTMRDV